MKDILALAAPIDQYSLKMIEDIKRSKLFKIRIIITTKNQKKNIWKLKKIVKDTNCKIFCHGLPHRNKKITNLLLKKKIKLGISTGFVNLIKKSFLRMFEEGIISVHHAYLPDIKGSHSPFWSILNARPYGSSLHYMNEKFDSGKIIDRIKVKNNLFTTAEEIFHRSRQLSVKLMKKNLKKIYKGKIKTLENKKNKIYFKKYIEKKINLNLNETIKIKKLWAIIRGTKFDNHGIFFNIKNKKFKVISTIEEV